MTAEWVNREIVDISRAALGGAPETPADFLVVELGTVHRHPRLLHYVSSTGKDVLPPLPPRSPGDVVHLWYAPVRGGFGATTHPRTSPEARESVNLARLLPGRTPIAWTIPRPPAPEFEIATIPESQRVRRIST